MSSLSISASNFHISPGIGFSTDSLLLAPNICYNSEEFIDPEITHVVGLTSKTPGY